MLEFPRAVEVLHDGRWCPGWLEAFRRDGDGWRAFVRYGTKPGQAFLQWRACDEVRSERL